MAEQSTTRAAKRAPHPHLFRRRTISRIELPMAITSAINPAALRHSLTRETSAPPLATHLLVWSIIAPTHSKSKTPLREGAFQSWGRLCLAISNRGNTRPSPPARTQSAQVRSASRFVGVVSTAAPKVKCTQPAALKVGEGLCSYQGAWAFLPLAFHATCVSRRTVAFSRVAERSGSARTISHLG